MQQVEVHILEQSYRLTCPDGAQDRLLRAARRVNEIMTGIRDAGKPLLREQVAVLAAVTIAFDTLPDAMPIPQTQDGGEVQEVLLEDLLLRLDEALQEDTAPAVSDDFSSQMVTS